MAPQENRKLKEHRTPARNPLASLHEHGQAVWLDFLARRFIADGSLKKLIEHDGLTGVTSNPSIFAKAIAGDSDYDSSLKRIVANNKLDLVALYEQLAIEDIGNVADLLRPVFEATKGSDGFVSLEVSPYLAMSTEATITEARRLWRVIARDNIMIKVPATSAGLPAIRQLTSEGININITLLFSQHFYEQVVEAYLSGLEHLVAQGRDPSKVASVASFFVSRIDVAVDKLLDERLRQTTDFAERKMISELRGKVAIANAKLAYQRYKRRFSSPRWEKLRDKGARVQRLLWASTGTKNKDYSDVLYIEELIGPGTINTMPPATIDAFRDHGKVRLSLDANVAQAEEVMATLHRCSICIDAVTAKLTEEAVQLFADAFDKLFGVLSCKRDAILGETLDG
jgi:transaldolase/glucose-6-phosphate isomerase